MKIRDCPCGEKPELNYKQGRWTDVVTCSREEPFDYIRTDDEYWFTCPKCNFSSKELYKSSVKRAIKAWNKVSKKDRKGNEKHTKNLIYYAKISSKT